jgi:hypothetical protein
MLTRRAVHAGIMASLRRWHQLADASQPLPLAEKGGRVHCKLGRLSKASCGEHQLGAPRALVASMIIRRDGAERGNIFGIRLIC